jgi:hypothetical protein
MKYKLKAPPNNTLLALAAIAIAFFNAHPATAGNVLNANYLMPTGTGGLDSNNGCFSLRQQGDGNLVLYHNLLRQALWHTATYNRPTKHTIMQSDGNLVSYDTSGRPIWASGTDRRGGTYVILQDDGNLVMYAPGGRAIWASNTVSSCNKSAPSPNPAPADNPDLNLNIVYDPSITPTQRAWFTKAILNWDSIVTRDMVNQGRVNIYVRAGRMTVGGNHWAETSTALSGNTPRLRQADASGYHATITFNSGVINSLNNNQFIRLATHELGHALYLNEAQSETSLGLDGIMHSTNLPMNISEGVYRKLEWFGYSVNRNPSLQWY